MLIPKKRTGYSRVTHPFATNHTQQVACSPFDLHVLSTPPAFVLSQDQTLQQKPKTVTARKHPKQGNPNQKNKTTKRQKTNTIKFTNNTPHPRNPDTSQEPQKVGRAFRSSSELPAGYKLTKGSQDRPVRPPVSAATRPKTAPDLLRRKPKDHCL